VEETLKSPFITLKPCPQIIVKEFRWSDFAIFDHIIKVPDQFSKQKRTLAQV